MPMGTANSRRTRKTPDGIRFGETFEIDKRGAKRYEIFEPTARTGDSTAFCEHRIELDATCLIDRQRVSLD
jgi:hypothetical protein